jgi:hypothetical protein
MNQWVMDDEMAGREAEALDEATKWVEEVWAWAADTGDDYNDYNEASFTELETRYCAWLAVNR